MKKIINPDELISVLAIFFLCFYFLIGVFENQFVIKIKFLFTICHFVFSGITLLNMFDGKINQI